MTACFCDVFLLASMPGDPPTYDKTQFEFIVNGDARVKTKRILLQVRSSSTTFDMGKFPNKRTVSVGMLGNTK